MVEFNPSSIFLIGGIQDRSISSKTWIINPNDDFQMKEGPSLNVARFGQACGKFKLNGKLILVVAGGYIHDSVELMDPESNLGWINGIKIHFFIAIN